MHLWTGFNVSMNLFLYADVITNLFIQWNWYWSSDFIHILCVD
jgi:hypothetical protein